MVADENANRPWQRVANWLFASLIAVGAYVWNQTVAELKEEKQTNIEQAIGLARLQEWRDRQDETNRLLRESLSDMNRKLDRLLVMPEEARAVLRREANR